MMGVRDRHGGLDGRRCCRDRRETRTDHGEQLPMKKASPHPGRCRLPGSLSSASARPSQPVALRGCLSSKWEGLTEEDVPPETGVAV